MESLAIIPTEPNIGNGTCINTWNFLDYLNPENFIYSNRIILSRKLNLFYLTPSLKELYASTQECFIFSEKEKQKQTQGFIIPNFSPSEGLQKVVEWFVNSKDVAERNQVLYMDHTDSELKFTTIKHGDFASGDSETLDLLERGDTPFMEIHTHPTNSLPSPVDYSRMLARFSDEFPKVRLLRSILVLCPDIQILGVATPDTALLAPKFLNDKIKSALNHTEKEKKKLAYLARRERQLSRSHMKFLGDITNQSLRSSMDLTKFYEEISRISTKYTKSSNKAHQDLNKYLHLLRNISLLQFAREMNITLYASTNMKNFEMFSA